MANPLESVRVIWSSTDEAFFQVTAGLFPPAFLWGAGVLLASYDPEPAAVVAGSPRSRGGAQRPATAATAVPA